MIPMIAYIQTGGDGHVGFTLRRFIGFDEPILGIRRLSRHTRTITSTTWYEALVLHEGRDFYEMLALFGNDRVGNMWRSS